jgi:hypothetical protein
MARNYPHIKNEELRNLIKIFCDAKNIRIKFIYRMNKAQLCEIIEKYGIWDWIVPPSPPGSGNRTGLIPPKPSKPLKLKRRHYKPDRYNMPNISRDNIYVSDSNTFKYLKDLNCFDTIQYVHIKNLKDDDIIEFKYKNEYDENFNKISTIYMGTIAGIGFNHKVN